MKKIVYAILACIIIVGAVIIGTIGLNVDLMYSKNVELDIYIGKEVDNKEIESVVKEVFPGEKVIVRKIELFNDMVSITMKDKSDEEIDGKLNELNTKINEKFGIENDVNEDINVIHNPKIKLSTIIKPYIVPIIISMVVILIYVWIRYKQLGILKTMASFVIYPIVTEAVYLSLIAITRLPINRLVIPIGLMLYIVVITVLGFINEGKLLKNEQNKK